MSIIDGEETSWSLNYDYYTPMTDMGRVSGVYIFCPEEIERNETRVYANATKSDIFIGNIVTQIVTCWEEQIVSKITIFKDLSNVKIDTLNVDTDYSTREEIVMRVNTKIKNDAVFYTDSNGMEMQKRKLNFRENWEWSGEEPISGNYYPITSAIYIEDSSSSKRAT